ncbi:MAG TPA: hypothetical protein VG458_07765 [Solirubrobacterales bacterium]|nr:hypothetical protein [Solirubrobacterales bacterium]
MCMQCMATAATAGAAATGVRAWLATRGWLSARLLKRATAGMIATALFASAAVVP